MASEEKVDIVCKLRYTVYGEDYDGYDSYPENEKESSVSGIIRIMFDANKDAIKDILALKQSAYELFTRRLTDRYKSLNIPGVNLPRLRKSVDVDILKVWRQIDVYDKKRKSVIVKTKLIRLDKPDVLDLRKQCFNT